MLLASGESNQPSPSAISPSAIIHPTTPSYSFVSLAIVAVASLVKFGLGAVCARPAGRGVSPDGQGAQGYTALQGAGSWARR